MSTSEPRPAQTGAVGGDRANCGAVAEESEPRKPLYSRPVARRRGLRFQSRIVLLTLAGGVPALLAAVLLLREIGRAHV